MGKSKTEIKGTAIKVGGGVIAALLFGLIIHGCFFDQYAPSDAQLTAQKEKTELLLVQLSEAKREVAAMQEGEEKEAAQKEVDALYDEAKSAAEQFKGMQSSRADADSSVGTAAGGLNTLVPGLGLLLSLGYNFIQRTRDQKNTVALQSVLEGIEDFKKVGGEAAAETLITGLKDRQNGANIRDVVRDSLAELRQKKQK